MPEDVKNEILALLVLAESVRDRVSNLHEAHSHMFAVTDKLKEAFRSCG